MQDEGERQIRASLGPRGKEACVPRQDSCRLGCEGTHDTRAVGRSLGRSASGTDLEEGSAETLYLRKVQAGGKLIKKVTEELRIDEGRLVVLYVEDDGRVVKYRYLFARKDWDRTEWVRLDHTAVEPSHVHLRRRTEVLRYVETALTEICRELADLSDKIPGICSVIPHD